ncbi:MAG: alpha/beta hydrolase [Clostridiales bacterium]|nr:alpha/beta hydrolase [Clostridiales bacterium]
MVIKSKEINKEIRPVGEILRAVSPLDKKWFQLFASPLSGAVLSCLKLKKLNCEKMFITRKDGSALRICVFKSADCGKKRAGILWLHGGGYVLGAPEMAGMSFAGELIRRAACVLVAPDYVLSAKKPYPGALEDAYLTLKWIHENRAFLGIEKRRLVVGGESAGGGLAAALCIYARDKGFNNIGMQLPLYPMLDDRPSKTSAANDAPVWNTAANKCAWEIYLGENYLKENVPPYAAPGRECNYSALPGAISFVGTAEPFFAETAAYFSNLQKAGTEAYLLIVKGAYHAFDMMNPRAALTRRTYAKIIEKYNKYAEKYL